MFEGSFRLIEENMKIRMVQNIRITAWTQDMRRKKLIRIDALDSGRLGLLHVKGPSGEGQNKNIAFQFLKSRRDESNTPNTKFQGQSETQIMTHAAILIDNCAFVQKCLDL